MLVQIKKRITHNGGFTAHHGANESGLYHVGWETGTGEGGDNGTGPYHAPFHV